MEKADTTAALNLLLTKKWAQSQSLSDKSASTHSDSEIRSSVRHDSLVLKLHADFINKDILQTIEENPA
ncbi:hypothetical protein A2U01_0087530, partial [Trifolium medium]|nr:hypothetical protein [Trifolium medium]